MNQKNILIIGKSKNNSNLESVVFNIENFKIKKYQIDNNDFSQEDKVYYFDNHLYVFSGGDKSKSRKWSFLKKKWISIKDFPELTTFNLHNWTSCFSPSYSFVEIIYG